METSARSLVHGLSSAGGVALGAIFSAASRIRPATKPLHPRGRLLTGTITRTGLVPATGVPWLDQPGRDEVLVRVSRAIGLPESMPDIHGIAVRVPCPPDGAADLLLAGTGTGAWTRFLLSPSRTSRHPHSTLLPYRAPTGALVLAALPRGDSNFDLACASPRGQWRRFGVLDLGERAVEHEADPLVAFDPMLNTLPGLTPYDWVRRLRERAYAAARRSRS